MFAINHIIEQAITNDDNQIKDSLVADAIDLCVRDPTNIQKIVRALSVKLSNSFVVVRIKALIFLQALVQYGPPACINEIRLYAPLIASSSSWVGEPHPTRGMDPYEEMRDVAQTLLQSINKGNLIKKTSRFANAAFPESNFEQQQAIPQSITTPYPQQTTAYNYQQQSTSYSNSGYVPQQNQFHQVPQKKNQTLASVEKWFNRTFTFTKRSDTSSHYNIHRHLDNNNYQSSSFMQNSNQSYGYQTQQETSYDYSNNAQREQTSNLLYESKNNTQKPMPVKKFNKDLRSLQTKKPKQNLSPAKKLMKVTGGRAMASANELATFKQNITVDSIDELIENLDNGDWKVSVRAILGLEIAAEVYGIQAVSKCKNDILSLTGAPQLSLRTESTKFYEQIKNVQPSEPKEISRFDFVNDNSSIQIISDSNEGETIKINVEKNDKNEHTEENKEKSKEQVEENKEESNEQVEENKEESKEQVVEENKEESNDQAEENKEKND